MLSARNIVAGYVDEIDILQNVSIDVEQERITSVIGPNGSGKSTLMRVICGFLKPKSGQVLWGRDGPHRTSRPRHGRPRHLLPAPGADRVPAPHGGAERPPRRLDLPPRQGADSDASWSGVYGLFPLMRERRGSKAGDLSGGMQKILEVARGMMTQPPDPDLRRADGRSRADHRTGRCTTRSSACGRTA